MIEIGKKYQIHSYKHNGGIHRSWDEAVAIEETDEYIVFGNNRTKVINGTGGVWRTYEPAVIYFFKNNWYNVIAQIKKDGIYYYCNIASPFIIEENTIKYIDYDLDLRVFGNGRYKVLDENEYAYHAKLMLYPDDLKQCIKNGLNELITRYNNKEMIFDKDQNMQYHHKYLELIKESNN